MKTITRALTIVTTAVTLLITSYSSYAQEQQSYSVAQTKDKQSKENVLNIIKTKISEHQTDKIVQKTQYLTREQYLKQKQAKHQKQVSAKQGLSPAKSRSSHFYSFSIYEGFAQLIEDFDEDGYFQTFSVTFDADAITSSDSIFNVYAELYLSKNGGPWTHYYTTDDFTLYGESEDDIYEVYTTLEQGYPTDEYDVLIDLYEVGYGDIVASYSSDDTNDLYALPLESSDYDPEYIIVHDNGGSTSIPLLVILSLLFCSRFIITKPQSLSKKSIKS
ncbi:choice-of-anchor H family protein [Thalassotalea piscium]